MTMPDVSLPEAIRSAMDSSGCGPAVVSPTGRCAAQGLVAMSSSVARALADVPSGREPVLVLGGHAVTTVGAMLGIGQAGRCYLVLDHRAPVEFLSAIVARHGAVAIVTDRHHDAMARRLVGSRPVLVIDDLPDRAAPSLLIDPHQALSVSYTSGTSGVPKAVVHSHRNVVHNALAYGGAIQSAPEDVFLVTAPFSSVAAATPTFTALLVGATLAVFELQESGPQRLAEFMAQTGVTVAHLPPYVLPLLAEVSSEPLEGVRLVSLGGDPLRPDQARAARRLFPAATLLHRYSTSETNWIAGHWIRPSDTLPDDVAVLGTPVPWVDAVVVGPDDRPVGPGEVGELLVSGDYLALGYLDDPELTSERFVECAGVRTYRTGDRVRRLPDGALAFAGRADDVVKVRGVRVDLIAVERALRRQVGVTAACVVAGGSLHTEVTAFVVGNALRPWRVRADIAALLPSAMVPARIVLLPELPMTVRGKVDREALRSIAAASPRPPYSKPRGDLEATIAGRFSQVLSVADVGREDDCFALGADSLATAELCALLEEDLGVAVDTATLLENPTPTMLAEFVRTQPGRQRAREDSHLVTVARGANARLPVVMFSGGGGGHVDGMAQLARALDDRTAYVVMPRAFESRGRPDRSVDAMARSAVADIVSMAPCGAVILVGHSSGGTVALEAARQLSGAGVEVPLVVLLDTLAMTAEVNRNRRFLRDLGFSLREGQRRRAALGQGTSLARKAYWVMRFPVRRGRRRWLAATAGMIGRSGRAQHEAFEALVKVANRRWREMPYDGVVHLIRAAEPAGGSRGDVPDLRWSQVQGIRVDVTRVSGTHNGMTAGAQAVGTAQVISRICALHDVDRRRA